MICYAESKKYYSIQLCEAFASGCGGTVDRSRTYNGDGLISGMGWWQKDIMQQSKDWWQADYGYFWRGEYWRITHKGLWSDGFGNPDYKRLDKLNLDIHSRRHIGSNVLVIGQSKQYYDLWTGQSDQEVFRDIQARIWQVTDRQIVIRRKPINGRREPPLQKQLNQAWIVVTHSSGVALQALMQGIPVVVLDESYGPHRLSTDIERIDKPLIPSVDQVRQLCAVLAANQFTMTEMRSGKAWGRLSAKVT